MKPWAAFLLGLALACVWAQDQAVLPPPPPLIYDAANPPALLPARTSFCFVSPEKINNLYYKVYPADKQSPPYYRLVNIPKSRYSNAYPHNGQGAVEFYWIFAPSEQPVFAFRADIPFSRQQTALLLRPTKAPGEKSGWKVEFSETDVSVNAFPAGSFIVINLADRPLAGAIGKQVYKPLPAVVSPQKRSNAVRFDIYAYIEEQHRVTAVLRSDLEMFKTRRYWVMFFPAFDKDRTQITHVIFPEPVAYDDAMVESLLKNAEKAD